MKYEGNTRRRVRCKSGLFGERSRLQSRYSSFEQFEQYSDVYGLSEALGYLDPFDAWNDNPIIESSVEPRDFRKVG